MSMLVRRIAVLSVVWAMCELLLPDGRYQQMVRMTAGLLVMTALLSSVDEWLDVGVKTQPVMTQQIAQASEAHYHRTALAAVANQLENCCVRMAQRAGYQAEACVFLTMDGAVDHIDLLLGQGEAALAAPEELVDMLARYLSINRECIWLSVEAL
ncbi:MAG: stage III sporulation protein AF [Clostridia bacterium]|nr:stage III sporulation protein AF [Clostridia bacterium]